MSAIGNIFWNLFDRQSGVQNHHDALDENAKLARENIRTAGRYFASPYTIIRDAYKNDTSGATGWKKFGMGVASAIAAVPLTVRGLLGGTFYGLLALKNGAIDGAAHGIANMFDSRHGPAPAPQPAPSPSPSKPDPTPAPAPSPNPGAGQQKVGRKPGAAVAPNLGKVRIRVA